MAGIIKNIAQQNTFYRGSALANAFSQFAMAGCLYGYIMWKGLHKATWTGEHEQQWSWSNQMLHRVIKEQPNESNEQEFKESHLDVHSFIYIYGETVI